MKQGYRNYPYGMFSEKILEELEKENRTKRIIPRKLKPYPKKIETIAKAESEEFGAASAFNPETAIFNSLYSHHEKTGKSKEK
jgi:hypothetical protein